MLYKKFKADRTAELVFNIVSNRYFGFTEQTGMVIASIQQLMNEAEQDMKNSADRGGCYLKRPKVEVDNTLPDLLNSSYPTKAEFAFIIHSKYFLVKNIAKTCLPASMLSLPSIVYVQVCPAPQIFSKQNMSPSELSSCCF